MRAPADAILARREKEFDAAATIEYLAKASGGADGFGKLIWDGVQATTPGSQAQFRYLKLWFDVAERASRETQGGEFGNLSQDDALLVIQEGLRRQKSREKKPGHLFVQKKGAPEACMWCKKPKDEAANTPCEKNPGASSLEPMNGGSTT